MADLRVDPEGLRATAGSLEDVHCQSAGETGDLRGDGSQGSVAAALSIAEYASAWNGDESGYHGALSGALNKASVGFESVDGDSGLHLDGAM